MPISQSITFRSVDIKDILLSVFRHRQWVKFLFSYFVIERLSTLFTATNYIRLLFPPYLILTKAHKLYLLKTKMVEMNTLVKGVLYPKKYIFFYKTTLSDSFGTM